MALSYACGVDLADLSYMRLATTALILASAQTMRLLLHFVRDVDRNKALRKGLLGSHP